MPNEEEIEVPDIYTNGVQIARGGFDLAIILLIESPPTGSGRPTQKAVGRVRMSLEHAKVLSIILRKTLKEHEDAQHGPIRLLPEVMEKLGISKEEDW
jgi:hypothetical protein